MPYLGEVASLFTAICWSTNAVLFAKAGRRVGSPTVNMVRLGVALGVMLVLHLATAGTLLPHGVGAARLAWLGTSGLIGFALGDALLFEAYILLGPRLTVLVFTLWPVFAALLAFAFLGQSMTLARIGAMVVTLGGIALVVSERGQAAPGAARRRRARPGPDTPSSACCWPWAAPWARRWASCSASSAWPAGSAR